MIKTVIATGDMVMVFDECGEQISKYQGPYEAVRDKVLHDAPRDALFAHGIDGQGNPIKVDRNVW